MRDLWDAQHKCDVCNKIMKKDKAMLAGIQVRSWKCLSCNNTVLHPEDAQRALFLNKLKRGVKVKVGKLGESLIFRFPKEIADFYEIKKGEDLIIKANDENKLEITT